MLLTERKQNKMETKEQQIKLVFDEIENQLKEKNITYKRERDESIYIGSTTISYSGSYNMGRFGYQNKCWIEVTAWINNSNVNRRVEFGDKNQVAKVMKRVEELVDLEKQDKERKEKDKNELSDWKQDMKNKFGDVEFPNYSDRKEFEYKNARVEEIWSKYDVKISSVTEEQLKKIMEALKE